MITKQDTIVKTIEYLNERVGSKVNSNDRLSNMLIGGLHDNGIMLMDFYQVIDFKSKQWKGTKYAPYLRPQTLFGNKFQQYLYVENV